MPSYTYTNHDTLRVEIDMFHFEKKDIPDAVIEWKLTEENGTIIDKGVFGEYDIINATLNKIGNV